MDGTSVLPILTFSLQSVAPMASQIQGLCGVGRASGISRTISGIKLWVVGMQATIFLLQTSWSSMQNVYAK